MYTRKIRSSEFRDTRKLFAIAFEAPASAESLSAGEMQRIRQSPRTRDEFYRLERWAAFTDDDAMMACLIGAPAPVRFDGHEVPCTCIGGVSCRPEFRRQGAIASCFRQHFADAYDQGAVLSYLYPFSTVFYRQFGYELCVEAVDWRFDIASIPEFTGVNGTVRMNEGDREDEAIRAIYAAHMQPYNLSFCREDWEWQGHISQHPERDGRFTYVWRNAGGEAKAYFTFRKEYDDSRRQSVMACSAFHFVDAEGVRGLLNFIRSFRSHFQRVHIRLPRDCRLERILPEVSGSCERTLHFTGMGRVINVRRALELARYQGSGEVCFAVDDPCLPRNSGMYRVVFEDGRCVSIDQTGTPAVTLGMADFSRLLLGGCEPGEYPALSALFYPKRMHICDYF